MIWLWLACGDVGSPPVGPAPPRHAEGWSALVGAAERADLDAVHVLARDVSLGPVAADPVAGARPEVSALAAALGFLSIAQGAQDVREGIGRARSACDGCHAGLAVPVGPS